MRKSGFTLIEMLVVVGCVAVVAAILVPGMVSSRRASNERQASTSLRTLASAEADFRANDRDGNRVYDFWTGDVKGLFTMTSAADRGASGDRRDPPLKLIELQVAAADADASHVSAGGENTALAAFASPAPFHGHWFGALELDRSLPAGDPDAPYRQDTGGAIAMGACHHPTRFGFITFPDSPTSGKYLFLVNENNTEFRSAVTGTVRNGPTPPGLPAGYRNWPNDDALKSYWSKFD